MGSLGQPWAPPEPLKGYLKLILAFCDRSGTWFKGGRVRGLEGEGEGTRYDGVPGSHYPERDLAN